MCKNTTPVRATAKIVDGQKLCCVCESKLKGRKDKAFCNYKCKNEYHRVNRIVENRANSAYIKNINRNFHIFGYLMGPNANKICVHRQELLRLGFRFDVSTSAIESKRGITRHVYEYSWYRTKGQNIIIIRDKNFVPVSPYVYRRWEQHLSAQMA